MQKQKRIGIMLLLLCCLLAGCRAAEEGENDSTDTQTGTPTATEAAQPSGEPEKTAVLNGGLLLGCYRGLSYEPTDTSVSEAEVEEQLTALAAFYGEGTELTDELIAAHFSEYQTVEEYRGAVRQALQKQKEDEALRDKRRQLLSRLIASAVLKKDISAEVAGYRDSLLKYYQEQAAVAGESLAEYCSRAFSMEEAAFERYLAETAENYIRARYCLRGVAELEQLSVTDEQYETMLPVLAQENGYEDAGEFAEAYSRDVIRDRMLCELAFRVVLETAVAE